jgi:hypothetical protein
MMGRGKGGRRGGRRGRGKGGRKGQKDLEWGPVVEQWKPVSDKVEAY